MSELSVASFIEGSRSLKYWCNIPSSADIRPDGLQINSRWSVERGKIRQTSINRSTYQMDIKKITDMYTYQWAYIYIHMDKTQHCLSHVYHVLFSILFCPCKHFVLWWFSCTIEVYQILYFVWITSVVWIWVVTNSWSRMTIKIISIQNMAQIVCTKKQSCRKKNASAW